MNRIKEHRQKRGLTQEQLADVMNTSQVNIGRWERGERALKQSVLERLAKVLNVTVNDLLSNPAPESNTQQLINTPVDIVNEKVSTEAPRFAPVYASREMEGHSVVDKGVIVEQRPVPSDLSHIQDIFAVYVTSQNMEPRMFAGELIWIHPSRPSRPGDDVLLTKRTSNKELDAYIGRLVRTTDDTIYVTQYNPAEDFTLPRSDWTIQQILYIDLQK